MNKQSDSHSCLIQNENLPLTVTPQWFDPDYWKQHNSLQGGAAGRGTTHFFSHENQDFVLRAYLRGGMIGRVLKDRYLFLGWQRSRVWRELKLLEWMYWMGLPVPVPVAGQIERQGVSYRAKLIMQRLDAAEDLIDILAVRTLEPEIWQQIGVAIARLHQADVYHHDLNCKNIMLDSNNKVWLIDFDRCRRRSSGSWKQKNLQRLLRSFNKELQRQRIQHFSPQQWQLLLNGYHSL